MVFDTDNEKKRISILDHDIAMLISNKRNADLLGDMASVSEINEKIKTLEAKRYSLVSSQLDHTTMKPDIKFVLWTDDEMIILYNLKKSGFEYKEIANVLEKSMHRREYNDNVCKKKYNSTDWNDFFMQRKTNEEILKGDADDIEKQRIIESTLLNQERLYKRDKARTDIIIDGIKSAIYRLPKPRPSALQYTPKSDNQYSEEHMGVILSDMHIGASYTNEATGGLGEYNLEIYRRRMNAMKQSLIEIAERHRLMYKVPHLHVFCLGDVVAGMNDAGDWSPVYMDMGIVDQSFEGVSSLRDTLAYWATAFEKVSFYGVPGNHARCGKRGTHKYSDNWDRLIYSYVRDTMSNYDNIEWDIPESWWIMKKIKNHNFYLVHGDGIKGSMGIPYYGIEKSTGRVAGLMAEKPEYTLMGHFHSTAELSTNFGKVIVNGSFMGADMYSTHDLQKGDRPEQKVFGIHHKKGVTWSYNIHLDEG